MQLPKRILHDFNGIVDGEERTKGNRITTLDPVSGHGMIRSIPRHSCGGRNPGVEYGQ